MNNKIPTRTQLDLAFRSLNGADYANDCFCCAYGRKNYSAGVENPSRAGMEVGRLLRSLGVARGDFKTFNLDRAGMHFDYSGRRCGLGAARENGGTGPDLDWQAFIDEVVSLVGE